jgi:hypothetical protein
LSGAAEQYVKQCTHPKIRGGARDLFEAIAELVPEGQTATPAISMETLAAQARLHRRTVVSRLEVLVDIKEVRVIDGGQGRVARYELVHLEGTRPLTATPLPLVGVTPRRKVARPLPPAASATPDLFDEPADGDRTAINMWRSIASTPRNMWRMITSWCVLVITSRLNLWRSITGTRKHVINDHKLASPQGVAVASGDPPSTTKYVQSTKNDPDRTYEAGGGDARAREDIEQRPEVVFVGWFTASFPVHNRGALYTMDRAPAEGIATELLRHRSLERLQALSLLMWKITSDEQPNSDRAWIAASDRGLKVLRHKINFLDQELARASDGAAPDVWTLVLAQLRTRLNRNSFDTWWKNSTLVDDRGDVILVQLTPDPTQHGLLKDWIERNYAGVLIESLAAVRVGARVEFVEPPAQRAWASG